MSRAEGDVGYNVTCCDCGGYSSGGEGNGNDHTLPGAEGERGLGGDTPTAHRPAGRPWASNNPSH
ncbi:hypothetical protein BU14_0444s0004 [Porphyra umbilicalis]|uniref:Uncharacterized protein n=1 Tax=Porphyra umbilicalis TaxID=2786 RepID=A0A1X6NUT9_PORUM|nr:hypothetical protein BU14_0444s0004 [Porphyra umbilicalis]|eukprot:OSX72352.1 hypothetical protein BU14_0444s0004 [Porphyra umbilicalis]